MYHDAPEPPPPVAATTDPIAIARARAPVATNLT
jgi:hypothetical protein